MRTLETYRVPANSTCINVSLFARTIRRVSVDDQLRTQTRYYIETSFARGWFRASSERERFQSRVWRRRRAVIVCVYNGLDLDISVTTI